MNYVTDAEIQGYLNMESSSTKFTASAQNADAMEMVRLNASSLVSGKLPVKYLRFQKHFDGYVLTDYAADGQDTFAVPASMHEPISCKVWVNLRGVYRDRNPNDTVTAEIVPVLDIDDNITGYNIVLAEPLTAGDKVYADIRHSGQNPPRVLKKLALDLAVDEIIMRKPALCNDPQLRDAYTQAANRAHETLKELSKGNIRIDEWDTISESLVPEKQTVGAEGGGTLIVSW